MFPNVAARYSCLLDFLLAHKENLLHSPYHGNLEIIMTIYKQFCVDNQKEIPFENVSEFLIFLEEFNGVSADSLEFGVVRYSRQPGLKWIDVSKIQTSKSSLQKDKEELKVQETEVAPVLQPLNVRVTITKGMQPKAMYKNQLIELLNIPLHTTIEPPKEDRYTEDPEHLKKMLASPTAMTVLGIERAKLLAEKKPFYEACENATHSQTLANLCLNVKSIGLSVQDLPSNVRIHRVIQSCKSMIGKDVMACVKSKIHYLPLVTSSTDLFLGNCSYLDTCHKLKSCRYLHYYTLNPPPKTDKECNEEAGEPLLALEYTVGECLDSIKKPVPPPQWINCDVRKLPFSILGKFAAIISDPAWDIHMSLPYGTCKDTELLSLPMAELQDEGILLLWVTGRSIEIGRKALQQWGYTVSDEVIWVKLNQLRRTIVTGRTGHWLNHSKEHLLLGVKGNPVWLSKKVDLDIIVSGTRETSRKPDELYGMVERMVGRHSRKLEIFGRDHNIRPGWFSEYKLWIFS